MTTSIRKLWCCKGISESYTKTHNNVKTTSRILRQSGKFFSGAEMKGQNVTAFGVVGFKGFSIVELSRMKIRGSTFDGGVADGLIPRYIDNSETTATLENLLDSSNSGQGPSASGSTARPPPPPTLAQKLEAVIERAIFDCRFLTLFGVFGSLAGSMLCFLQGSMFVMHSFKEYIRACMHNIKSSQVILYLVEAVDVYLMGTVMLIFGMGLFELFVNTLDVPESKKDGRARATIRGSNLFGLFTLQERPKWLEIRSLDELKTKLGHVIVMILLVGMFEKSKKVPIHSGMDLLCFAGSILLASSCLYLLSMLHSTGKGH